MQLQQSVGYAKQSVTETVQCWTLLKGTFNMIAIGFLSGVIAGLILVQVCALGWMFWDMFKNEST